MRDICICALNLTQVTHILFKAGGNINGLNLDECIKL